MSNNPSHILYKEFVDTQGDDRYLIKILHHFDDANQGESTYIKDEPQLISSQSVMNNNLSHIVYKQFDDTQGNDRYMIKIINNQDDANQGESTYIKQLNNKNEPLSDQSVGKYPLSTNSEYYRVM